MAHGAAVFMGEPNNAIDIRIHPHDLRSETPLNGADSASRTVDCTDECQIVARSSLAIRPFVPHERPPLLNRDIINRADINAILIVLFQRSHSQIVAMHMGTWGDGLGSKADN